MATYPFTPPKSDDLTQSSISTIRSYDPQNTLSQRLQDMADELSSRKFPLRSLVALNRRLDAMESLLSMDGGVPEAHDRLQLGLGISGPGDDTEPQGRGRIMMSTPSELDAIKPVRAEELATEGSSVLARVTSAVEQLRQRQEELRHFHNIAIAKAEDGANRINDLEWEIEQLETDVLDDQSELSYLESKLRILEFQALPQVFEKGNSELSEGIGKWKADWEDVDVHFRKRRRRRQLDKKRKTRDWARHDRGLDQPTELE